MPRRSLLLLVALSGLAASPVAAAGRLKVAASHPLIADLVRQVGGENVEVVNLLKPGADAHHFEPTASDLAELRGSAAVFVSGKNLEHYLDKLGDSLGPGVRIIDVGRTIPSMKLSREALAVEAQGHGRGPADHGHDHGHADDHAGHAHGEIDPHWWHSASNMARACRVVGEELGKLDPARAAGFKTGAAAAAKRMQALKSWAAQQLSQVPKANRKLVTAHAAFGYFCKEHGFSFLPILGLSREADFSPKFITEAIRVIRANKVVAVFPEDQANPKVMAEIVRETGVKVAPSLIADGTAPGAGSTFEGMLRHNVNVIVGALKP
jgi:zinc/manganese transport system substrate-binding protein